MKLLISIFFCFAFSNCFCNETLRKELDIALRDEKFTNEFISRLEAKLSKENQGYLASAYMMKSNHASMPWTKLKYFYKGKKLLEKAINEEPDRVELRFFRYEIQTKIPKGLNYNNIDEDKKILLGYIQKEINKNKDSDLYQKIQQLNLTKG
jgi:hypothetical protein